MAKKLSLPTLMNPPVGANGGGESIFTRVNPFAILIGMGIASVFAWFLTGGGGGNGRKATHLPEFRLGEEVGGQTITGIRTRWEYQVDDYAGWLPEERL